MTEGAASSTRPLSAAERALLEHLLTPDFTGVGTLRLQAAQAEVIVQDAYPWFIELRVPPSAPPATDVYRNPVTRSVTADPTCGGADITLWLDGDYLTRIEVMWLDEQEPQLPSPTELHPATPM